MVETRVTAPGVRSVATPATPPAGKPESFSAAAGELVGSLREAADAQAAIWSLKGARLAALIGFGLVGAVLLLALTMYGFSLLDGVLDYALSTLDMPGWYSPLVRGAVYFGLPVIGMAICWHVMVGYGTPEEDA